MNWTSTSNSRNSFCLLPIESLVDCSAVQSHNREYFVFSAIIASTMSHCPKDTMMQVLIMMNVAFDVEYCKETGGDHATLIRSEYHLIERPLSEAMALSGIIIRRSMGRQCGILYQGFHSVSTSSETELELPREQSPSLRITSSNANNL